MISLTTFFVVALSVSALVGYVLMTKSLLVQNKGNVLVSAVGGLMWGPMAGIAVGGILSMFPLIFLVATGVVAA